MDREAGLPQGSCSAYYRSRAALQTALVRYVAAQVTAEVEQLADSMLDSWDGVEAAEAVTVMLQGWLSQPARQVAHLELSVAASRDAELAGELTGVHENLIGVAATVLARRGLSDAHSLAETIVAALDGVLLAALKMPAAQRAGFVAHSVRVLILGATEGGLVDLK